MRRLYHMPLCPFSRTIRLALAEKKLGFQLVVEKPWEERQDFVELNPAGTVPVLVEPSGAIIAGYYPVSEYLEDAYPGEFKLFASSPITRAEVRRVCAWMNEKFYFEVSQKILFEKVFKRFYQKGWADSAVLRQGAVSLGHHLEYLTDMLDRRDWMGGPTFTIADLAVAAHLSCLDFIGYVPWEKYPLLKSWYACIKSRPSFRPLLLDQFSGIAPPDHYKNLDF